MTLDALPKILGPCSVCSGPISVSANSKGILIIACAICHSEYPLCLKPEELAALKL